MYPLFIQVFFFFIKIAHIHIYKFVFAKLSKGKQRNSQLINEKSLIKWPFNGLPPVIDIQNLCLIFVWNLWILTSFLSLLSSH